MQHLHAGLVLPQPSAMDMGGHGLYSPVGEVDRWMVASRYAGLIDAA